MLGVISVLAGAAVAALAWMVVTRRLADLSGEVARLRAESRTLRGHVGALSSTIDVLARAAEAERADQAMALGSAALGDLLVRLDAVLAEPAGLDDLAQARADIRAGRADAVAGQFLEAMADAGVETENDTPLDGVRFDDRWEAFSALSAYQDVLAALRAKLAELGAADTLARLDAGPLAGVGRVMSRIRAAAF